MGKAFKKFLRRVAIRNSAREIVESLCPVPGKKYPSEHSILFSDNLVSARMTLKNRGTISTREKGGTAPILFGMIFSHNHQRYNSLI
jgi:hypothetical protein